MIKENQLILISKQVCFQLELEVTRCENRYNFFKLVIPCIWFSIESPCVGPNTRMIIMEK